MSKEIVTVYTDDLDGSQDDVCTVSFGFGNKRYEIDLSGPNRSTFIDALWPYVLAAHQINASGERIPRKDTTRAEVAAIRRPDQPPLDFFPSPKPEPPQGRQRAKIDPEQARAVRQWAAINGHVIGPKRPIPPEVLDAYQRAKAPK